MLRWAFRIWIGIAAALGAGVSCLVANSVTRAALADRAGPEKTAAVMAVWAIAWAGSKPLRVADRRRSRQLDRSAVDGLDPRDPGFHAPSR